MKINSLKILTWAYSKEPRWITRAEVEYLLADISQDGVRSSLFLLEKNNYLLSETFNNNKSYMITSYGKSLLEAKFPALNVYSEVGNWQLLMFLKAPDKDPSFRYLRKQVLATQAFSITRGAYLHLGSFPDKIMTLCKERYLGNLVILAVDNLVFGDERLIIGQKTGYNDELNVLSSLSKEIDQLIGKYSTEKTLIDKQKIHTFSIFHRLYDILTSSNGVLKKFFPQVEGYLFLLEKLQKFSISVFS